jgi:hypothetical protein
MRLILTLCAFSLILSHPNRKAVAVASDPVTWDQLKAKFLNN